MVGKSDLMLLATILMVLGTMTLTAGCGGGEPELIPIGNRIDSVGTFAYVEEVTFPPEIRAGELVEVQLKISMASNQDKLFTSHSHAISVSIGYKYAESGIIEGLVLTSSTNGPFTGPAPRTEYDLLTLPFPAGQYTLYILSADSRESGGLTSKMEILPSINIEPHPNLILREFPFTVLPAEDAAEE